MQRYRQGYEGQPDNMHQSHGAGTLNKLHKMHPNVSREPTPLRMAKKDGVKLKINTGGDKKKKKKDKKKKEPKIIDQRVNQIDVFAGGQLGSRNVDY